MLQSSNVVQAESYPLIHLENPHSWSPSISSRASLYWCHKALFIFPFSMQPADSVFTSLLLLKPWLITLPYGDLYACLALPLPLDFFLESNLNVTPQADLPWRPKVGFLCYMLPFCCVLFLYIKSYVSIVRFLFPGALNSVTVGILTILFAIASLMPGTVPEIY